MTAYVVIELARSLRGKSAGFKASSPAGRKLKKVLADHEAKMLRSSQPTANDKDSSSITVQVSDVERADRLAAAVRGLEGVETAYVKPGEELP